jgi:hypothetical protein
LAKNRGQLIGDRTRLHVGAATGGKGNHEAKGPRRPFLRAG